jgi:hypothetical protein
MTSINVNVMMPQGVEKATKSPDSCGGFAIVCGLVLCDQRTPAAWPACSNAASA